MNRAPDRVQSRSGARGQGTARLRNTPALGGEHRDADAALGPGSSANRADGAEAATLGTGVSEDHPTARVPAELTTEPKEYQLQGLGWMLLREQQRSTVDRGLQQQPINQSGHVFQTNRGQLRTVSNRLGAAGTHSGDKVKGPATRRTQTLDTSGRVLPMHVPGDILCDETGLGKTLQALMLIVSHRAPRVQCVTGSDYLIPPANGSVSLKTTVIIVPQRLLAHWQREIRRHIRAFALRWGIFQPPPEPGEDRALNECTRRVAEGMRVTRAASGRISVWDRPPWQSNNDNVAGAPLRAAFIKAREQTKWTEISALDILFMSYEQLNERTMSQFERYNLWRVVLDEAQVVSDLSLSQRSILQGLKKRHAWAITGTPSHSDILDLCGLLGFLSPVAMGMGGAENVSPEDVRTATDASVRSLVHGLTLRRTRAEVEDQLDLPPCVREDVHVDMSLSERRLYIPLTVEFNQALQVIKAKMQGDSHTDTSEVQRQLEALRQCCCHPGMVGEVTEWRGVRETLGRIVLEAFDALHTAIALQHEVIGLHRFCQLTRGEGLSIADVYELMGQLCQIHADRQLFEAYDMRGTVRYRNANWCANVEPCTIAKMQDDIRSKVSFIFESLSTGQGLPADTVVFTETRELLSVLNPSAPRVWEAGPTHPTVADIAGWHAARAAATSAAPPPLVLTTLGPLETRSYGALAHAFFEAKETRAKAVGPPAHQQAAHIAQQLAQDELQREIDKVSGSRGVRLVRWNRLELIFLDCLTHLLCKKHPECVPLAQSIDTQQGPWGEGHSETVRTAAVMLWAVHQRMNAVRDHLGYKRVSHLGPDHRTEAFYTRWLTLDMEHVQYWLTTRATELEDAYSSLRNKLACERDVLGTLAEAIRAHTESQGGQNSDVSSLGQLEGLQYSEAARAVLAAPLDPDCPICHDTVQDSVFTECGHRFCHVCLLTHIHTVETREAARAASNPSYTPVPPTCPCCRKTIAKKDLEEALSPAEMACHIQERALGAHEHGAKVQLVLNTLQELKSKDRRAKALIVSSWPRLLHLVQAALTTHGIQCASLLPTSSSGSVESAGNALERFQREPDCRALLLLTSQAAEAAGVDFTEASSVFIMEPSLDPTHEDKVASRVHMLGQTRETRVVRLVVNNSVEQRIIALQDSRRAQSMADSEAAGGAGLNAGSGQAISEEGDRRGLRACGVPYTGDDEQQVAGASVQLDASTLVSLSEWL